MNRKIALLFVFLLISFWVLHARTIQHVQTIRFHDDSAKKKSVKAFIFGKKEAAAVKPAALCRIGPGLVCVTDAVNGVVLFIDDSGNIKKRIPRVKGIKIISPVSACTDDSGNLYIADSTQGGIIRFTSKLKFEDVFIAAREWRITGITFSKGFFYCVDAQGHRALCFDREGKLAFSFGKRGTGPGEFNFPTHITADSEKIYVTDAMNFRVQVFDHKGKFIRVFGSHGRGGGNFSKPKGIAVDKNGYIFVADAMFDNVQIFNSNGEFLYFFGGPGQEKEQFWMPSGVMVDKDDTLWVADTFNHRIQVFRLAEDRK